MERAGQIYKRLLSPSTTRALQYYQLMRQAAMILTSILLAKSGLATSDIGIYELLLYIGTVMTFFWVNGLLQAMTPVYARLDETEKQYFFFNNFLVFAGLSLLVFLVLFFGRSWMTPLLTGFSDVPYFPLFCLYLLFNLPAYPVEYHYLLKKQARAIVFWGMWSFGLQMFAVALPVWLGYGLQESIWSLIVLAFLRSMWAFYLVRQHSLLVLRPELLRVYLVFDLPLVLNAVLGNFILMFDNWLVGWWYKDEAIFAIYRYGARELPLAQALATALGVGIIPRLTEHFEAGLLDLKNMTRRLFHVLFPFSIVLILVSKWLFPLVFNPDFGASAPIFNIFLLITASRVLLPNSLLLAKGLPKVIFWNSILELCIKIVSGFVFIYFWGLPGLAWSVVLSFWFEKAGLMAYLRWKHRLEIGQWLDWKTYGVYLILLLGAYWVSVM